jgi:hypothetical protein
VAIVSAAQPGEAGRHRQPVAIVSAAQPGEAGRHRQPSHFGSGSGVLASGVAVPVCRFQAGLVHVLVRVLGAVVVGM